MSFPPKNNKQKPQSSSSFADAFRNSFGDNSDVITEEPPQKQSVQKPSDFASAFQDSFKKKVGGEESTSETPSISNNQQPPQEQTPSFTNLPTNEMPSVTTNDGYKFDFKNPTPLGNNTQDLQQRINSRQVTPQDIQTIADATGKSADVVKSYILGGNRLGAATENNEQVANTQNKLRDYITTYNKIHATDYVPNDVMSSAQKLSDFLQTARTTVENPQQPRSSQYAVSDVTRLPVRTFYNVIPDEISDEMLNQVVRKTVQEDADNGVPYDVTLDKIVQRINPRDYARIKDVPTQNKFQTEIQKQLGTSPTGILKDLSDKATEQNQLLNYQRGIADLKYNQALQQNALDKVSQGITSGNQELIQSGQNDLNLVDNNVINKYPALVKQQIAQQVNDYIAKESGVVKGYDAESLRGYSEKISGASSIDRLNAMKALGILDNPNTKDIALSMVNDSSYFADNSILGGVVPSFLQPFKDLGMSIGDMTGLRTKSDILSDNLKDQIFEKDFSAHDENNPDQLQLKNAVRISRNILNTSANLAGMTAIAASTEGLGEAAGLSTKAAQSLGAYTSFGLPSFDASLKDAKNFIGSEPAQYLYAAINSIANAEGGRILDLGKIVRIPEVSEDFSKIAKGLSDESLTEDGMNKILDGVKNKYIDFATKYGKNVSKGAATMAYFNIANNITKMAFGDQQAQQNFLPQAGHAFLDGVLGMSIIGLFGAAADMRNEKNTSFKGTIYNMALNHDAAKDVFTMGLKNGDYTKPEYDQKVQILNTAVAAKNSLDATEKETGIELTPDQKAVYVANKTAQAVFEKKANQEGIPEDTKNKYLEQANRLAIQSTQVLDGLKFTPTLVPLYDLYNAEKEYNQALENYSPDNAESENALEAAKNNYDKLYSDYLKNESDEPIISSTKTTENDQIKNKKEQGVQEKTSQQEPNVQKNAEANTAAVEGIAGNAGDATGTANATNAAGNVTQTGAAQETAPLTEEQQKDYDNKLNNITQSNENTQDFEHFLNNDETAQAELQNEGLPSSSKAKTAKNNEPLSQQERKDLISKLTPEQRKDYIKAHINGKGDDFLNTQIQSKNENVTSKEQTIEGNIEQSSNKTGESTINEPQVKAIKKRATPTIKSPLYKKALESESQDPESQVLKYFIGGGRINDSALREYFSNKQGEINARISLRGKDAPKTIDALAHKLWDESPDEIQNQYDSQDFRNAVEKVLQEHNSRTTMAEQLVKQLAPEEKEMSDWYNKTYGGYENRIPEENFNDAINILEGLSDEEIQKIADANEEGLSKLAEQYSTPRQISESDVEDAKNKYDKAQRDLKNAEDKLAKEQGKQTDIFNSPIQSGLFKSSREDSKSVLDPLKNKVKETKSELDKIQNDFNVQNESQQGLFKEGGKLTAADKSPTPQQGAISENKNVTSQKISQDANDIIAGKKVFERFSPKEQRGFAEGGTNHVEASLLLAAGEGAGGKDNTTPEAKEDRVEKPEPLNAGKGEASSVSSEGGKISDVDISNEKLKDEKNIGDYVQKAKSVLNTLYPDAKLEVYDNSKDYVRAGGESGTRGFSILDKNGQHRVLLNLEQIKEDKSGKTAFHEVIHPIVYDAFGVDKSKLVPIWNDIAKELTGVKGFDKVWDHVVLYDRSKIAPEGITEFLTQVAAGNIDLKDIPKSNTNKVIDLINRLFDALGIKYKLNGVDDLYSIASKIKDAFDTGNAEDLKDIIKGGNIDKYIADYEKQLADKEISKQDYDKKISELKDLGFTDEEIKSAVGEIPPQTPTTEKTPPEDEGKVLEESVGKSISLSKNLTQEEKNAYAKKDWKYFQRNHESAAQVAKSIVDAVGINKALALARSQDVRGDVKTMIYGESWTRAAQNARDEKLSAEEKQQWADREADIVSEASKLGYESGITSSAFAYLYKRSPLGLIKSYGKFIRDAREDYLKAHEGTIKSAYDDLIEQNKHLNAQNQALQNAINKRKPIINKERQENIDKFFDKLKLKKDVSYSSIIPPPIWNGAIDTMRLLAKSGSAAADVIKAGIDYLNERIKDGFDADKFRKDIEPEIQKLVADIQDKDWNSLITSLKPSDRRQTEKQISKYNEAQRGIRTLDNDEKLSLLRGLMNKLNQDGLITNEDLDAYGNGEKSLADLMGELGDKNREKVVDYIKGFTNDIKSQTEKSVENQRFLERWEKKLKFMSEEQRNDLIKRSVNELSNHGVLDYENFRQMFADVLGMPTLDEATKNKIIDLAKVQNNAQELADKLRKDLGNEDLLNQFIEAKKKAEEAAIEQQKLFSKPQGLYDKFLWGIRMNTLSLKTQAAAGIGNMMTLLPRTMSGAATSLSDMVISKIPFANNWFGDEPLTKTNYFLSASNIPKAFSESAKQSIKELWSGVYSKNIGANEFTKTSPIHPTEVWKSLYDALSKKLQGKSSGLTKKQLLSKVYDGSAGAFAEMMARTINFTHNTFGERQAISVKEMIGKQLGYSGTKLKSFMELPNDEAKDRIEEEAKRTTFQQDNILTNFLGGLSKSTEGKSKGTGLISKLTRGALAVQLPFPRFAMNYFTYTLELASPEYSFLRAMEKGIKKDRVKFNYYMGQAMTGMAIRYVVMPALVSNNLFSPATNYNQQSYKQQPEGDMPAGHFNLSGFLRMMRGGNPQYQNGDFTVDSKWLGALGEEGTMMSDKYREMSKEAANRLTYAQQVYYDAGWELNHIMSEGVLSGAFNGMQSFTDGQRGLNGFVQQSSNMMMNAIYPQTLYQGVNIIRDSPKPQISDYEDKGFYGMVKNTSKTAMNSVLDRFGLAKLPPQIGETGQPLPRKSAYTSTMGRNTVYEWQYKLANIYENSDNGKGKKDETLLPSSLKHEIEFNTIKYNLNDEEYSQFKQKVNTLRSTFISAAQHQSGFLNSKDEKEIANVLKNYYKLGYEEAKQDFIASHPDKFGY